MLVDVVQVSPYLGDNLEEVVRHKGLPMHGLQPLEEDILILRCCGNTFWMLKLNGKAVIVSMRVQNQKVRLTRSVSLLPALDSEFVAVLKLTQPWNQDRLGIFFFDEFSIATCKSNSSYGQ